jgi:hypothetical protein
MTSFLFALITCLLGAVIGLTFADIDLAPPLPFRHRSAWTHGPLIVYVMIFLLSLYPGWFYWFVVGFLPANAIHLLADMFPRNWKGGAMVKLHPIKRELAPILSFAWLGYGVYISCTQWLLITSNLWGWWPL